MGKPLPLTLLGVINPCHLHDPNGMSQPDEITKLPLGTGVHFATSFKFSSPLSARTQTLPSDIHHTIPILPHRSRRRPVWLFHRSGLLGSRTLGRTQVQVLCDLTTPGRLHLRSGVLRLFYWSSSLGTAHRLDNKTFGFSLLRVIRDEDRPRIPTTL
jgi:hypothetical protein